MTHLGTIAAAERTDDQLDRLDRLDQLDRLDRLVVRAAGYLFREHCAPARRTAPRSTTGRRHRTYLSGDGSLISQQGQRRLTGEKLGARATGIGQAASRCSMRAAMARR
ncbi:hypothetical protein AB0F72_21700 [Actinoplanes sp. NPDC023936]|uniref:hypothetical protein n=1 Tax=Actinoplanes sp. NPDC023936 TaxID=3154910 RepID=UPI0033ECE9BB